MFGCNKKFHFSEIHFLLTNIYSFDPEIILHSYFQFTSFPKREREREREREPRSERERERKKREPAIDEGRDRPTSEKREPTIDERRNCPTSGLVGRSRPSSITIASALLVDHDRVPRRSQSSIALLVGRSHQSRFSRAISSSPPLRDLNFTGFDEFFCWILFLL